MKAIITRYKGPTDTRGARIIASDDDGNRVSIPASGTLSGESMHFEAVKALCAKMQWHGTLMPGSLKRGYVWVWVDSDCQCRSKMNV